jgi:dTDP-4-dehydrorhamnose 3,5-epimerase-like enzyme
MAVKQFVGNIEILTPSCNLSTVHDGRGGIFTWVPDEPIVEFNLLYFSVNKVRGNHFHPEFTEYFLVVEGTVLLVTRDPATGEMANLHASRGVCFKTPPGTSHAVHAITPAVCVSMLTKPWDACSKPIVHEALVEFDEGYKAYLRGQREGPLESPEGDPTQRAAS